MAPRAALEALFGSDGARVEIRAPTVGLWRDAPGLGALLWPGEKAGALERLGALAELIVPLGVRGVVVEVREPHRARRPVSYGDVLLVLDASMAENTPGRAITAVGDPTFDAGLLFVAPMGGRLYRRPAQDKPPFVEEGEEIEVGKTVCLLEVMKTFNRVSYGGDFLPRRARVTRILPKDGADVAAGDPILVVEPAG
jgi:acetyl-CoA carboxylase biotin carboxyl carrier protein